MFSFFLFPFLSSHQLHIISIFLFICVSYFALIQLTFSGRLITDEDIEKSSEPFIQRMFPILSPAVKVRYMIYKKSFQRFDILFWVRITIGAIFYFGRCNVFHGFYDGPYFRSSIIMGIIAWSFWTLYFIILGIEILFEKESTQSINAFSSLKWVSYIQERFGTGIVEEIAVVFGQISFGLSLYARVMAGPCQEGTTWLETARCNPSANGRALPMDVVMYMTIFPIVSPQTMRSIRFESSVLMWFVLLGFVMLSMDHINAGASITLTLPNST